MIINLNNEQNVNVFKFPDGQPHVNIGGYRYPFDINSAWVICSLTSSDKVLQLLELSDALDGEFVSKEELHMPYLMGARFDRRMQKGDSFDLKVIAKLINSCRFKKVFLYDVHSDVATALIENSVNIDNKELVKEYLDEDSVLICPDAGAAKKVDKYQGWNGYIKEVVHCVKSRDLSTGQITLKVLEPERCKDRNCVIIDDICDGGNTFIKIAEQIQPKKLTLIVTHGIFSQGFATLEKYFQQIITSDSFNKGYESQIVKTVCLKYI